MNGTIKNLTVAGSITGTLVGEIDISGPVNVSSCYWLDSLTLTNFGASVVKNAVGRTGAGTVTRCSSFTADQGQAAIGSGLTPVINTETGKYSLADVLNVGKDVNSSWTVDPLKNSDYPIFESDGYKTVSPPTINTQPTNQSAYEGENFTLNLTASGDSLTYQWYQLETNSTTLGGTAITPATNRTYPTSQATAGSYYYYCLVTATNVNDITAITRSDTVTVTVKPEASWELTTGGTTDSGTLAVAVDACNGNATGGTITLNKNLILASTITINKTITLVSAGVNKITRGNDLVNGDMFTVSDGATLTLGKVDGMGDNNTLSLDGGAVWSGTSDPILGRGTTYTGRSSSFLDCQ